MINSFIYANLQTIIELGEYPGIELSKLLINDQEEINIKLPNAFLLKHFTDNKIIDFSIDTFF